MIAGIFVALASMFAIGLGAELWSRHRPTLGDVLSKVATLDDESRHKICAHRANNISMYRSALRYLECIEIDTHVSPASGGLAGVYHPPDSNFRGLTLEQLLAQQGMPEGHLWLDTKDLAPSNWSAYLELLSRVIPPERRGDVVVETVWWTPDVEPVAAQFRSRSFAFSYYLPTDEAIACAERRTAECDALRRRVLDTLARGFSHLSFDSRAAAFAETLRPMLPPGVKFLTWDLSRTWKDRPLIDDVDLYIVYWPGRVLN